MGDGTLENGEAARDVNQVEGASHADLGYGVDPMPGVLAIGDSRELKVTPSEVEPEKDHSPKSRAISART